MTIHRPREPILVLGANSLVGRHLLPQLAGIRAVTAALSRSADGESADGVRWIRGDLEAPERIAWPYSETVLSLCPIWLLPRALPRLRDAGVRRLIAFSSTSVSGKASSSNRAERMVAVRLADAEESLQRYCAGEGIAWTILRPTLIYCEGQDGNITRLARLAERYKVIPLAGAGQGRRQPVHAEDLAWAALATAVTPAAEGRIYDLPGGETLTYREMVERIFLGLDRTPRIVCAPVALWRLAFRLARGGLPGATEAMGERMTKDLTFDGGPAARDFGWAPRLFKPVFTHIAPAAGGGR